MLNKLRLAHNINRFYKTFGTKLNVVPAHTKLRDLKDHEFLHNVTHDINEVLETSACTFNEGAYKTHALLTNIYDEINGIIDGKHNHKRIKSYISFVVIILVSLLIGYTIGRHTAIRQAELVNITDTEYQISYDNEVHIYTFED